MRLGVRYTSLKICEKSRRESPCRAEIRNECITVNVEVGPEKNKQEGNVKTNGHGMERQLRDEGESREWERRKMDPSKYAVQ